MNHHSLPDYLQQQAYNYKVQRLRTQSSVELLNQVKELQQWEPAAFIEQYFYIYDTESLFEWHPSQLYAFLEATKRDANGYFKYHTVIWSWPKKSAKSTVIAAIVDYICLSKPKAAVRLIGHDLRQADSRVGYYMRENIKIGAKKGYGLSLEARILQQIRQETRIVPSGYQITYPNGSKVEMVPVDPRGEAGGNDDLIVFSELWAFKHQSHQDMWAEVTIAPTRFGKAQRWVDTYAGFEGDSPILEPLYKRVVKDENRLDIEDNDECYADGKTFATWVTVPRLAWQTKAYYRSEQETLLPEQFARLHRNQWTTSTDAFIPLTWWDSCVDTAIPKLGHYDEMAVCIDAGITDDGFAIVGVSRDRRIDYNEDIEEAPDVLILRYARVWYPDKNHPLKFDGYDGSPADELRKLASDYNVVQFGYDKWQMAHFVNQLDDEGLGWFEPFSQAGEREIGDKMLYDIIRQKRILHTGRSDQMRLHLGNANKKIVGERRMRIVKRSQEQKIDLAVALAMACKRAVEIIPK